MHSTPNHQKRLRWEADETWLRFPSESRERCQRLLAHLLRDVVLKDLHERSDADDRQDSTSAS